MTASTSQRGPRVLFGLVGLVLVLALGWHAVGLLLDAGRGEGSGDPARAEDGPPPGWGLVVLGAPSGAPARPRALEPEPIQPQPSTPPPHGDSFSPPGPPPAPDPEPTLGRYPEDLQLVVRSGQSLSKIIAESYGRSTPDLVRRLATYNGMDDPDRLRAGQVLRVPVKEKLLATTP